MAVISDTAMALRIAARNMRGGPRSLWLLTVGVFIGAAAVALVGATSQSLIDGARQSALETVGGDLSLRLFHRPPSDAELAVIGREGDVSISTELRPMAGAVEVGRGPGASVLVELKGVDAKYPLYGVAKTRPASNLHQLLDRDDTGYGAVADAALFDALNLEVGDRIQIGRVRYRLRGVIAAEPDRAFRAFTLGPRVIVSNQSLPATGLVDDGAQVYHYVRVKLPPGSKGRAQAAAAATRIDQAHPQSGWRMVNAHDGVPGVERTLAMAQVLLLFVGLGVMLVGGAGISGAVRAHTTDKMVVIALLKSIGAPPRVVTMAIGFEVMAAAALGALIGVGLGAFGPVLVASALVDHLPFELDIVPRIKPLLTAGTFVLLVTALFAWWPLMGVQDVNARVLLRDRLIHPPRTQGGKRWLGAGAFLSAIVAVVFWMSPMPVFTTAFLAGAFALAMFYFALGKGLSRLVKRIAKGRGAGVRLALGNLHRAGAPTGPVVMALGLSLTLLVALDSIGAAVGRHMQRAMPHSAPDLVAFSLSAETAARLGDELDAWGIVERRRILPFLHARVQAINGVAVRNLNIPGSLNWVVRGDRGVSFAAERPDGTGWVASAAERAGFSLDAGVAAKLGLGIGDRMTLNVSGHVREGPIVDLRHVDWTKLDLDFPIIATPNTFSGIPFTFAASLKANPGNAARLEALIKNRFPDAPLIRVADVLESLAAAMEAIVSGMKAAALMCGLAAMVVLGGSVLQGIQERTSEAVLFKVLGARRRQLLGQLTLEFLALGILVALAAVPLGFGIAHAVTSVVGLGGVGVSWNGGVALAGAATLLTLTVGLLATAGVYTKKPAQHLRGRRY